MANVKVSVAGNKFFFSEIMDDSAVTTFVTDALAAGYYYHADTNGNDIYIPFAVGEVTVLAEDFEQSTRQDAGNFGPDNVNPIGG